MFSLDRAIAEWRRLMVAGGIKSPEVLDELEGHLRDDVEQMVRSGSREEEAFEAAVQRIGHVKALKLEFVKAGDTKWALLKRLKNLVARITDVPFPPLGDFNASAKQTLELARAEAPRLHHDFIGTEHVLLGLLGLESGVVSKVLGRVGVDREAIRAQIAKVVGVWPPHQAAAVIPYTPRARKALLLATREAKALKHAYVGTEHILMGLLMEGSGVAALVLKNLGVQIERTREEILKELDATRSDP
jgi:hypothetical protein